MSNQRSHYATTTDGVTIGGTVHGQGPPLVFVHGMMADGDTDWKALLPHLTGRFTCHLPSYRGRGLSGDHPELIPVAWLTTSSPTSTASRNRPDWSVDPTPTR